MKRFTLSLISSILAFTAGLVTASSWTSDRDKETLAPVSVNVAEPFPPKTVPTTVVTSYMVGPPQGFDFGEKGLKLVPERVQLKSESVGYDIDVSYPQISGIYPPDAAKIRTVNQHLKESATKLYQWPLNPQRRPTGASSGIRDTVNFTYQVGLATDSLLSVQFIGYSYDGSNGYQLQDSFSTNYDLTTGKQLRLVDLFKPGSKYLEFISKYCIDWLSSKRNLKSQRLAPRAENFDMWQITYNGIAFNFHPCEVLDCAEGEQSVPISFSELKPLLNPDIPGKFQITYP